MPCAVPMRFAGAAAGLGGPTCRKVALEYTPLTPTRALYQPTGIDAAVDGRVALIAEFVGGAAATAMAVVRSRMKSDASFFWRTSCGTACEELAGPEPPPPA